MNQEKELHCQCIKEMTIEAQVAVRSIKGIMWSTKRQTRIFSIKKDEVLKYLRVRADKSGIKRYEVQYPEKEWDRTIVRLNGDLPLRYTSTTFYADEFSFYFRCFTTEEEEKLLTFQRFDL